MPARDLPDAPFKVGQVVTIREPGIKSWTAEVMACKPTRKDGWWVSLWREGCEIVIHESFVWTTH